MTHPNLTRLKDKADAAIEAFLKQWPESAGDGLYAPVHYLMRLGGKRLRAVLALSAATAADAPTSSSSLEWCFTSERAASVEWPRRPEHSKLKKTNPTEGTT